MSVKPRTLGPVLGLQFVYRRQYPLPHPLVVQVTGVQHCIRPHGGVDLSGRNVGFAMASASKKTKPEIELEPNAWPRFEHFIKEVAKAGPQHRKSPAKAEKIVPPKRSKPKSDKLEKV